MPGAHCPLPCPRCPWRPRPPWPCARLPCDSAHSRVGSWHPLSHLHLLGALLQLHARVHRFPPLLELAEVADSSAGAPRWCLTPPRSPRPALPRVSTGRRCPRAKERGDTGTGPAPLAAPLPTLTLPRCLACHVCHTQVDGKGQRGGKKRWATRSWSSELERMSRQVQGSLAATQLPKSQTLWILFSFPPLPAQPPPTSASPPQADLGASPSPHQGAQCIWATGSLLTPRVSD